MQFETVSVVPNTYHHPQRYIDTVVHGDSFVAVAEEGKLDPFEQVLENFMETKRVGRIGPGRSSTGKVLKRVVHWSGDGFTWEADPRLIEKLTNRLNLSGGRGALTPGGKDIGRDVRDSDCELEHSEAKLVQAAAGLEQYIALDRPDIAYSVKTALQQMSFAGEGLVSRPHLLGESAQGIYHLTSVKLKGGRNCLRIMMNEREHDEKVKEVRENA